MRCFFLPFLLAASFAAGAQTVKIKDGTIWVDNKEYVYIVDETPTEFTLTSMESDSELVFVKLVDPTPGVSSDFDDRYYHLRFPDFDREAILRDTRKASVIKFLVSHGLIEDGHINKLNFQSFIEKYGLAPEE